MSTSDNGEFSTPSQLASRKRPTRTCKKTIVIDSDSENSSDEVLKKVSRRKRAKVGSDSDESFCIEVEEKKAPVKTRKKLAKDNGGEGKKAPAKTRGKIKKEKDDVEKPTKTVRATKKTPTKVNRKRVKKEKSSEACDSIQDIKLETEDDQYIVPNKKIKTEPALSCVKQELVDTLSSAVKQEPGDTNKFSNHNNFQVKKEFNDINSFQNETKEEIDVKYNPAVSSNSYQSSFESKHKPFGGSQNQNWTCYNPKCGGYNYAWRRQCFRCKADKPKSEYEEPSYKTESIHGPSKWDYSQPPYKTESKPEISKWNHNQPYKTESKQDISKWDHSQPYKTESKPGRSRWEQSNQIKPDEKPSASNCSIDSKTFQKGQVKTTSGPSISNFIDPNEDQETRECKLVTKRSNLPYHIVSNIIKLFNSDATIPFIVRYRSHLTGGLSAEEMRQLKQHHESVQKVIEKAKNMKKKLEASGYLDDGLSRAIDSCVTQSELDYLNEPFKVLKSSKLVKVIDLGLSTPADSILTGNCRVSLEKYIKEDLDLNEINDLIIYYVGEIMSKDTELLDRVRELIKYERITLASKQKTTASKKKAADNVPKKNRPEDVYSNYYEYECPYNRVRPHQILAINRGESEQCLQVTLTIPDSFQYKLCQFAKNKWYFKGIKYELRDSIFKKALDFMYNKRVSPYVKRLIRSELTKEGEKASLEVFSSNLKYLLLTPPIRNVTVCAVDPGFTHGCKIAILSPQQVVLKTDVLYLNNPHHFGFRDCAFVRLINDYNVDLLVVGNGKGCRDVEFQISQLISSNCLNNSFKYIVGSENGISVYSCSPEAKEEYPDLSPNIISAISLAKRVQDPLCELVKVEPKHLGVGMYQHDINEKKLDSMLDDVVSECVSIVGVDLNNAPLRILKRVAGLTESKAKTIIEVREKQGSFFNRDDLKKVKGVGPKTFQQCAGFIKIIPGTCIQNNPKCKPAFNHFDQTIIHPEDYSTAAKILKMSGLQVDRIGTPDFVDKIKLFMTRENLPALANSLDIPIETLKLILEALSCPLDYDIRSTFDKPLFRNKATTINDLELNSVVSGQVQNVTHFGAFVDLGIETNGLIPHKNMQGRNLHLGQIVKVKITQIDTRKMRISLELVNVEQVQNI